MDKFKNKYRVSSTRLQSWDYRNNGAYFITICTANRKHLFGEIVKTLPSNLPTMQLNEIGKLAEKYWMAIPEHFPFVELGNFVIMPNHTHGILIIDKQIIDKQIETLQCNVSTGYKNIGAKNEQMAKISPKPGSISTIIRSYKSVVSKNARKIDPDFGWQSRFHDHIIRNDISFNKVQNYITNNPLMWNQDKFYK
ncbi:transposase [Polaribacter undariae]|uniref:Transposase n=1 Tax=Polaribacter sejongensis TaxID=985043 RepID=A0AAJ1VII2_9FLAO|nr:transposase [Polaribacter undariae]MDN3621254.1 transposase [Polaribacter undariae]UWD33283.1 transposase [Polaribacter undariae]